MEGCPKDCGPFLVETTEKLFVFAAENSELEDWTQKLCEIAFPMNWSERGTAKRNSVQRSRVDPSETGMEDNSLYSRRECVPKDFKVTVRKTEASERCRLRGSFVLRADFDCLILMDPKSGDVLYTWPYRFLRRFGRDKVTFSFEAGRRCDTGEGNFEFETKQGNSLFQAVEMAINLHKNSFIPHRQQSGGVEPEPAPRPPVTKDSSVYSTVSELLMRESPPPLQGARSKLELPSDKLLTGVKSLTLDTRPPPRKNQVKNISSCPLLNSEDQAYSQISMPREQAEPEEEVLSSKAPCRRGSQDSEYSLPFDAIAKNLMANMLLAGHLPMAGDKSSEREDCVDDTEIPDPLYDSIDESVVRSVIKARSNNNNPAKVEHIYDEPEGCAAGAAKSGPTSFYDDPEEVKGYAWKLQGTAVDPCGHEYPYNPHIDDYAVPKPPMRAFPERHVEGADEEDDSPYDNVMVKVMDRGNR
ncbi:hypothetical protein MATL_G00059150 [Megalops atlanticus]|uniref:IRS-type PTB domain-containing protein n=1 Tax=Megalops atlanticus TaxID=7932 RepID=A0A9D3THA2_MEGAT|nr:hypothetical protein MATL_G00059150 [Megalops atlanticus]